MSNNTILKNLIRESIATSERRNLAWYFNIHNNIHKSSKLMFLSGYPSSDLTSNSSKSEAVNCSTEISSSLKLRSSSSVENFSSLTGISKPSSSSEELHDEV